MEIPGGVEHLSNSHENGSIGEVEHLKAEHLISSHPSSSVGDTEHENSSRLAFERHYQQLVSSYQLLMEKHTCYIHLLESHININKVGC